MSRCPFCKSTDIVNSAARSVCGSCGEIVEDGALVMEGSFQGASAPVLGQGRGRGAGVSFQFLSRSNHELALHRGMSKLTQIATRMQLSGQIQEAGRRMYQLAISMNFNAGRPQQLVATACLYIICRRTESPHMLLDFADVLEKPVKVLGQTYMRLLRRLVGGDPGHAATGVEVPIIDPSIYIERFSRKLELAGNTCKVQNTAGRLIQLMHRDWICLGRRPNGLCGAALLIACYYHGLRCNAQDIADVVRIGEVTLRQRLVELKYTPLGSMGKAEFDKTAIERGSDCISRGTPPAFDCVPPCMRRSQQKEQLAVVLDGVRAEELAVGRALLDGKALDVLVDSKASDRSAMPPPSTVGRRGKRKRTIEDATDEGAPAGSAGADQSKSAAVGEGDGVLTLLDRARAEKFTKTDPTTHDIEEMSRDIASELQIVGILEEPAQASGGASAASADAAARIGNIVASKLGPVDSSSADVAPVCDAGMAADGARKGVQDGRGDSGDEEGLSEVDDEELDAYILDQAERQDKSDIWHEVNKGYLEEWHTRGKEAKYKKQRAASGGSHHSQASASQAGDDTASESGSQPRSRGSRTRGSSATESAVLALAKKGKVSSNRINIDALESLFS